MFHFKLNLMLLFSKFKHNNNIPARLAKCLQISICAMPVAFTGKYWQIMDNAGKYDLQPSTFRLVISIIEVIGHNI